jgi:hypothetical protein
MVRKFIVVPRLPYAGLGNMLLVWARAALFAELNGLPIVQPNWNALHIGPWLRGERYKRYYGGLFTTEGHRSSTRAFAGGIGHARHIHAEPLIQPIDLHGVDYQVAGRHVFLFSEMPPWNDYFQTLKEYQPIVKRQFMAYVKPDLLTHILACPAPQISIHIRRGDYQKPNEGDDFAVRRYVYTPLDWYIETLQAIRRVVGYDVPATVFSDGYAEALHPILAQPQVSYAQEASALSDMLTMSRSKVLIGSAHSSFSAWAAFLGQCPTVWTATRAHLYKPIFTGETGGRTYEGGIDPAEHLPELLVENLHTRFDQVPMLRV